PPAGDPSMPDLERKSLDHPDQARQVPKGQIAVVKLNHGMTFQRSTIEPGWRWSEHFKAIAGTDSCQALHTAYVVSGRLHVGMDDGAEAEFGPGDVMVAPPGHEAWVVGTEPVVLIDVTSGATVSQ